MTFYQTGLSEQVLKALQDLNFEKPTPIQEQVIPLFFESENDIIGLAQTGTGKTAAFGLPLIELTTTDLNHTQSLILCPTRELCVQISNELHKYAKYAENLKIAAVYGGANIVPQIKELERGAHIVVGTPGRVIDLINRKKLKLNELEFLVLDEADEMLNMGFKEDLDTILETVPQHRRTLLFSATMPKEIAKIAKKYMYEPVTVEVDKASSGAENVNHWYYLVSARDKYLALKRVIDVHPEIYGIVFCRTRAETREIAAKLMQEGYNADALHGDLSQAQRDYVMSRFRQRFLQILVATDVAARGLDVQDLTHVINYHLPDDNEVYIHRSGRTGRAGKKGVSISIIHTREKSKMRDIERKLGKKFVKVLIPSGNEVCEKQLFNLIDKVENIQVDESRIEKFLPPIYKKLEWLDREALIKKFVSVEFNRFLEYYRDAQDINIIERKEKEKEREKSSRKREGKRGRNNDDMVRFFISVGSKDNLTPPRMIGMINDFTRRKDLDIGKIDIMRNFAFFEVEKKHESLILSGFSKANFEGKKVNVEVASTDEKPKGRDNSSGRRRRRR